MKNWILKIFFYKELAEERRQGGIESFPLASKDILETMRDDLDDQAEKLSVKKMEELLTGVDMSKVVTVNKFGFVFIGGIKAEDAQLKNLKAEAEALQQMDIWKILNETPKQLAQQTMFVSSETINDLKKGKSMLFVLSQQRNIVDTFLKIK